MSAAAKEVSEGILIAELAASTLKEAKGDAQKAVGLLEQHAKRNVNVANALLMPLLNKACYDAIRRACADKRRAVWKSAESDLRKETATAPDQHAKAGAARVVSHGRRLMDFLLPHGALPLGDARQTDLQRAVEFYRKQAHTELRRARWLELVSEHVQGQRKVKNAVSEDTLRELFRKALNDV